MATTGGYDSLRESPRTVLGGEWFWGRVYRGLAKCLHLSVFAPIKQPHPSVILMVRNYCLAASRWIPLFRSAGKPEFGVPLLQRRSYFSPWYTPPSPAAVCMTLWPRFNEPDNLKPVSNSVRYRTYTIQHRSISGSSPRALCKWSICFRMDRTHPHTPSSLLHLQYYASIISSSIQHWDV